jgi:putative tryptophan/tyrosine transport system substrate-binding protein
MRTVIQRLSLGFVLIALSSAVLLISDWGQRKGNTARIPRVAIVQHASQPVLDDGIRGMLDALAAEGFIDGRNIAVQRFNAENDLPTANTIARQVTTGEYDMVITSSTLSMQTVANANKAGRVIHVFGVVADPFSAGIGISRENPLDHPKHLVGLGSMVPVDRAFPNGASHVSRPQVGRIGLELGRIEFGRVHNGGSQGVQGNGNRADGGQRR